MRRTLGLLLLLVLVTCTGCIESADTLSRDYRNLNNEVVDAMWKITDEAKATEMMRRVIGPYESRMSAVDERTRKWEQNNEKEDYGRQLYTSTSYAIFLDERSLVAERYNLEVGRITAMLEALKAAAGITDPEMAARKWPNLQKACSNEEVRKILNRIGPESKNELMGIGARLSKDDKLSEPLQKLRANRMNLPK